LFPAPLHFWVPVVIWFVVRFRPHLGAAPFRALTTLLARDVLPTGCDRL
jgi:hypothetical protein